MHLYQPTIYNKIIYHKTLQQMIFLRGLQECIFVIGIDFLTTAKKHAHFYRAKMLETIKIFPSWGYHCMYEYVGGWEQWILLDPLCWLVYCQLWKIRGEGTGRGKAPPRLPSGSGMRGGGSQADPSSLYTWCIYVGKHAS